MKAHHRVEAGVWAQLGVLLLLLALNLVELLEATRLVLLWRRGPVPMVQLNGWEYRVEASLAILGVLAALALFALAVAPLGERR